MTFIRNLNLALMKKGLRPSEPGGLDQAMAFKPCPDEEGIKTCWMPGVQKPDNLNLALMKKGLRRNE